ncbi:MAG: hypothetical protein ACRDIV_00215 [Ktedonobacteraceae bacterium]
MTNTKEQQLQAFARRAVRVSKALWPTNARRSIATSRAAQTRRQLIVKSRWWRWLPRFKPGGKSGRQSRLPLHYAVERFTQAKFERESLPGKSRAPNTPMPTNPPLVRVLETFDLSQTNIEHFLDLPDSGNTGGYSLESWKEAQMR